MTFVWRKIFEFSTVLVTMETTVTVPSTLLVATLATPHMSIQEMVEVEVVGTVDKTVDTATDTQTMIRSVEQVDYIIIHQLQRE